nr:DC1, C1-like, zinc finger, RING/FYVE/PHD-type [Tanacetum cinerariifolium]
MWSKHPEDEEEYDEKEEEMDDSVSKHDIRYLCNLCSKEITWYHRYYAHLDCATARVEPFMSIFMTPGMGRTLKNYDDAEHPDLLHLPFPDQTYKIPYKFSKEFQCAICRRNVRLEEEEEEEEEEEKDFKVGDDLCGDSDLLASSSVTYSVHGDYGVVSELLAISNGSHSHQFTPKLSS